MDPPRGEAAEPSAAAVRGPLPPQPRQRLAIVTCMDARLDPLGMLGLSLGDANVIRNAGATVSDDVLRSLGAAVERLGVARVVLIGHTDCAGHDSDASAVASVADGARRLRGAMPDGFGVDAFMYDVASGALTPV
jgi:carbonic anhydrase